MDWAFLEHIFGEHGKVIAAVIGLVTAIFVFGSGLFRYLRERIFERKEKKLAAREEELKNTLAKLKQTETSLAAREKALEDLREGTLGSDEQLWRLHPARKPSGFEDAMADRHSPVLMIANEKGGVGKTTLSANLAASFARRTSKKILLVDLDHQGSLSSMMFSSIKKSSVSSNIDKILTADFAGY